MLSDIPKCIFFIEWQDMGPTIYNIYNWKKPFVKKKISYEVHEYELYLKCDIFPLSHTNRLFIKYLGQN